MTKPSQETPLVIYLIPDSYEGEPCMVWCDDPAPNENMDHNDAVKYIRADMVEQS